MNPKIDAAHCGTCGNACGTGQNCFDGICSKACSLSEIVCNGDCIDTRRDSRNCGTCGNACAVGNVCLNGACTPCRDCPLWGQNSATYERDVANAVTTDTKGNVYYTGYFQKVGVFGTKTVRAVGGDDILVAKLGPNGTYMWVTSAGGVNSDRAHSIAVDANGNVYVAGYFRDVATFGSTSLASQGNHDGFVAKLDPTGKWLWAKRFGGKSNDKAYGVEVDGNGNVYVAGFFVQSMTIEGKTYQATGTDFYVVKIDDKGAITRVTTGGGSGFDAAYGMDVDQNGNVYLTGRFDSPTMTLGNTTLKLVGDYDAFVAKLDNKGQFVLATSLSGLESVVGMGIDVNAKGDIAVAGYFTDKIVKNGTEYVSKGSGDFFVAKWNASGQMLWLTTEGGGGSDVANDVAIDSTGRVFVTGRFQAKTDIGAAAFFSRGSNDAFVGQLSPTGDWIGATHLRSSTSAEGKSISVDAQDLLYVAGHFNSVLVAGKLNMVTSGDADAFVLKYRKPSTFCPDTKHSICSGRCTNTSLSDQNCGACGKACLGGNVCNNSQCGPCTDCLKWTAQPDSNNVQKGNGNLEAIATDSQGNTYMTGRFNDTLQFGSTILKAEGSSDIFVAKTSPQGKFLWAKSFGSDEFETSYDIKLDSNNNIYLAGYYITDINFGSTTLTSQGGPDVFVVKMDKDGNVEWAATGGGDNSDQARSISLDANGNVYVTGDFASRTASFSNETVSGSGSKDVFVGKLNSSGKWEWVKSLGSTTSNDFGESIVHSNGSLYVVGHFAGKIIQGTTTLDAGSTLYTDILVAKFDTNGKIDWLRQAGNPQGYDYGYGVVADKQGGIYLTGRFQGSAEFGVTKLRARGDSNVFIGKINSSGQWDWVKQFGSNRADQGRRITVNSKGEILVVGHFQNLLYVNINEFILPSKGRDDCFVVKYNNQGSLMGISTGGGTFEDYCQAIAVGPQDQIIIGGYTQSSTLFFGRREFKRATNQTPGIFVGSYQDNVCPLLGAYNICGASCTNVLQDESNCGKCANTCTNNAVCQAGFCR